MKFTKQFMGVLKVFSGVNQNMFFRQGKIQTSCVNTNSGSMVFFVRGKTDVDIERDFAIAGLGKLINAINLFDDPEVTVTDDNNLLIEGQGKKAKFRLTNPDYIIRHKNPDKVQVPDVGIKAELTEGQVADIHQMHGIFDGKYVSFVGEGGKFKVNIHSGEDANYANTGGLTIGDTDEVFNATISADLFHMPQSNYRVLVSRKPGFIYFGNETFEYFIPVDANHSSLGGL